MTRFQPTVIPCEPRLVLSTTPSPVLVLPPPPTGQITTLTPPPQDGLLPWLGAVESPIIVTMPSGTGQVVHYVTIVTARPFEPSGPLGDPVPTPLTWSPASPLT